MKLLKPSFLLLTPALALLLALASLAAEPVRLVGAAAVDITPDYPVRLSGYGSRREVNQGVAQHIFAKALAIGSDEEGPAVLVTVDNCGVPATMRAAVLGRLSAKTKVRDERFAIASSHTHCAPMLAGVLPNLFGTDLPAEHMAAIERYTRELTDKIEQVALAALADRRPSHLAWGIGQVGFAANRRAFPLKPVDHDLPVLRVTGLDGQVRAIFASYACHCTTIAIESIHGDWAGCAQEALQREFPGAVALIALGCGGDQNPMPRRTMELVVQYGEALGAEAKRLVNTPLTPVTGPLECRTQQIELAFDQLPTREEWQALAESKTASIAYHARKNLARLDRGEQLPTELPYLVQSWSFGSELAMVFLSGEVTVDYSLRIKREFDRARVWVNGYANDVPCYIPSRRVLEEGGYEGAGAMVYYDRPTKFAPDVEERIMGAVREVMPKAFIAKADQADLLHGADVLNSRTTYAKAYGETRNAVAVDAAKDLPRYPAVEPKDAIATWKVKPGFQLQLAAHEPQVRDPIAICFDENGRMFVCEMIDYSEMRDVTPHLGRISMLEDKDGDGYYETSTVFADDLPWPTGLVWASGGLYVGATPDIWRFEDRDGDGPAEVREKVFTGFGTGLKLLNVQGLLNSFQWGQDNRIHVLAGGGNRGAITCLKRPDLPAQELGGRDFWFDPRTHEFGLEGGGAQYGMSFDNYGRKFGCSNSDHLQFWVYDDEYAGRNPFLAMPPSRQSIAADGGAAEVFRLSPDEPWRIIRTRWRIAGVVKGAVEGGGRVSGYFTGATGTTVYRGDAYGADFVNNTFTGDAGGQLVHRKKIFPDGASLIGRRPDDEKGFEFAASTDTWVRGVNFANSPDGCLYICDMYREVIEHPWSIPDEIKKHLDLNSGNDRGRIYRIIPADKSWQRRRNVELGKASPPELVQMLAHPNGWHRDTAARLLNERQDQMAVPQLEKLFGEPSEALARFHALGVLDGLGALLREDTILQALVDEDANVRERAIALAPATPRVTERLAALVADPSVRVRFQLALALGGIAPEKSAPALAELGKSNAPDPWISAAVLSASPTHAHLIFDQWKASGFLAAPEAASMAGPLIQINAASADAARLRDVIAFVAATPRAGFLRALGEGLRRVGTTIEKADAGQQLAPAFTRAATTAADERAATAARVEAIELLSFTPPQQSRTALAACLAKAQPDAIQSAAIKALAEHSSADTTHTLLDHWPDYCPPAKEAALTALIARDDRATALLAAIQSGTIPPGDLPASQVQSLVRHKDAKIAALARTALASVIPPSRAEMVAKFQPALELKGDATRGQAIYQGRCFSCHRAAGLGMAVGPDLITVKTKGREALLTAILEPHKEVASQYIAYTVSTKEGQTLQGIITKDDASSLTVRMLGGAEVTVARASIKGSTSAGQSLMPEGLEAGLDVQGMADLLTFIEELK